MKRLLSFAGCIAIAFSALSQETPEQKLKALESKDTTITQKADTTQKLSSTKSDSTKIRFGKKSITIIEDDDNTTFRFHNKNRHRYEWDTEFRHKDEFIGHWSGLEFGINGLMDKNQSITLKNDLEWLDLKQARSWNINLNFMQYSIGFGSDKIGLLTGMGLEFNNYHFSNPISLKVENGITTVDSSYIKNDYDVKRTKLSTTHLTIPLLLEWQIPTGDHGHRIYLSGGVIGGLRIGAHTKVVYDDGGKKKDRNRDDFNLATFRYGFTARLGYRNLRLFANYYPVQLFEKDKGPEVYPFTIGFVLFDFAD